MSLTFEDFSKANLARCTDPAGFNHPLQGWSTSDWMTATLGELGEVANVVKKLNRVRDGVPGNKQSTDELRTQLRKELGDVCAVVRLQPGRCRCRGFQREVTRDRLPDYHSVGS